MWLSISDIFIQYGAGKIDLSDKDVLVLSRFWFSNVQYRSPFVPLFQLDHLVKTSA
jgi:hypothetical protein